MAKKRNTEAARKASKKPAAQSKRAATILANRRAKQQAFLVAFGQTGNITQAGELCGATRYMHYDWMRVDPEYPAMFADAIHAHVDKLKREATELALRETALREYKFYKGQPIIHPMTGEPYYEVTPQVQLLLAQLKAFCPEEYGDKATITHKDERVDLDSIPVGPGEPEEAFRDLMIKIKKIGVDKVQMTQVTTLSIAERAAAIKARRAKSDGSDAS